MSSEDTLLVEPLLERTSTRRPFPKKGTSHYEKHSGHGDVIRDIIIGFSDGKHDITFPYGTDRAGLTVPFALTAGLSSLGSTKVVITGGWLFPYPLISAWSGNSSN